jgi:hypothetical protein
MVQIVPAVLMDLLDLLVLQRLVDLMVHSNPWSLSVLSVRLHQQFLAVLTVLKDQKVRSTLQHLADLMDQIVPATLMDR